MRCVASLSASWLALATGAVSDRQQRFGSDGENLHSRSMGNSADGANGPHGVYIHCVHCRRASRYSACMHAASNATPDAPSHLYPILWLSPTCHSHSQLRTMGTFLLVSLVVRHGSKRYLNIMEVTWRRSLWGQLGKRIVSCTSPTNALNIQNNIGGLYLSFHYTYL
jgi:hypothetical protein